MWKYLWYMIYLEKKDRTEFDGVEQYCFSIISGDDPTNTRWLPVKIAKALSKMRDKYDLYTIFQKVTNLQSSMEKIEGNMRTNLNSQERSLRDVIRLESSEQSSKIKEDISIMRKAVVKKLVSSLEAQAAGEGGEEGGGGGGGGAGKGGRDPALYRSSSPITGVTLPPL